MPQQQSQQASVPLADWLPHAGAQLAQERPTPTNWPGNASSSYSEIILARQFTAQQLGYLSGAANITAAGFPQALPNDIPILQATIILEGDESCSAAAKTVASSSLSKLSRPDFSTSSASRSWPGVPARLARSTSDVTSYSTTSSNAAAPLAPFARSISEIPSYATPSSRQSADAQQYSQQQQQQCRPARQRLLLLQQLHARAKPAATARALHLAGRWWHQDAQQLSELLLLPDGTMAWLKQSHLVTALHAARPDSSSSGSVISRVKQLLSSSTKQRAAAGSGCDESSCSWSLQPYEFVAEWRGSWQLTEGSARRGKLLLTFVASQLEGHQHDSACTRSQQQKQQLAVVSFERGALDDVMLLDGLAHVRLT